MTKADSPPLAPSDKQPPHVKIPEPPAKKVGWAIVGLGQLAIEEVLPAFGQCDLAKLVALVSGHPEKAKKVAAVYGVDPKQIYDYSSYDTIAENPAVDVIYIILPNSMHAEYTLRGLKAGKHILCEKPMATSVAECEQMIAAAKTARRQLMIAYRLRYEPFNVEAIKRCREGQLGKLKTMRATNGQNTQAPNIRLSQTLGGGPLQDVGIYCLNAFRYLTGEEPIEVSATAHQPKDDPRFREVPETVAFALKFPSGTIAQGDCSFGTSEARRYDVHGTHGSLHLDSAFAYLGQRLILRDSKMASELNLSPVNHFAAEMDHFSECVLSGKESRTPGAEGLADLRVITAIQEAIRTGRTVALNT
ncbi:Gfo/Idh/MocA family protein [Schlesneria paludicola]|uniref:Gfo/Idh/MocA family protein n=1 Tax=Schlesneria paludicola TaxID=360056 RepID=UPI00192C5CF2|nr:Gfo/Idh/MocA family oxidoreductase [Schlesneria paludicola]